jgi:RES domain-containing protein
VTPRAALPGRAWRLVRAPWADLTGEGARRRGGRWNSPGRAVVYLSAEAALPVLEVLVHLDLTPDLLPDDYVLLTVDLAPLQAAAPDGWLEDGPALDAAAAKTFGDRWIERAGTPVLRVPSAIVAEAHNLVLNARHPLAARLAEPARRRFAFDPRLFA